MPNNKQGSGQTNKDMDRMSQGQRGGYGNTTREAGGSQQGLLVVASVLTSFYPAITVLLAVLVLREHIHRGQALGLALCAVTVGLVAAG